MKTIVKPEVVGLNSGLQIGIARHGAFFIIYINSLQRDTQQKGDEG